MSLLDDEDILISETDIKKYTVEDCVASHAFTEFIIKSHSPLRAYIKHDDLEKFDSWLKSAPIQQICFPKGNFYTVDCSKFTFPHLFVFLSMLNAPGTIHFMKISEIPIDKMKDLIVKLLNTLFDSNLYGQSSFQEICSAYRNSIKNKIKANEVNEESLTDKILDSVIHLNIHDFKIILTDNTNTNTEDFIKFNQNIIQYGNFLVNAKTQKFSEEEKEYIYEQLKDSPLALRRYYNK